MRASWPGLWHFQVWGFGLGFGLTVNSAWGLGSWLMLRADTVSGLTDSLTDIKHTGSGCQLPDLPTGVAYSATRCTPLLGPNKELIKKSTFRALFREQTAYGLPAGRTCPNTGRARSYGPTDFPKPLLLAVSSTPQVSLSCKVLCARVLSSSIFPEATASWVRASGKSFEAN